MDKKELLKSLMKSWVCYIEEEEKNNLQIDGAKVEDKNKFNIDDNFIKERVKENNGNLYITLPEKLHTLFVEQILQRIDNLDKIKESANNSEEAITLDYTVVLFSRYKNDNNKENKDRKNKKGKYHPFIIQTNTLSLSQAELQKILQTNQKERHDLVEQILIANDKLTFPLNIFSHNNDNVIVATHNINDIFHNVDQEDIAEIKNSSDSPISLIETLIGIDTNKTLNMSLLERYKNMVNKIKEEDGRYLTSFVMFDTDIITGTTAMIKRFLDNRVEDLDIFYENKFVKPTPVYNYIFGDIEKPFETYNIPSDTLWFGHVGEYPSAKGQALVTQKLEEGENLIAVQGPPGTGKTTLLLNVIAWALVKRALAIIDNQDINNLILVSSTAKKAVENATRDFEKTFINNQDYKFYSGFFLDFRNIENEAEKIKDFLEFLNTNDFSETEYKEAVENIKALQNIIISIKNLLSLLEQIKSYKTRYDKKKQDLDKKINQKQLFFDKLEQQNISKDTFILLYNALQYNKNLKDLLKKLSERNLLGNSSLSELANDLNKIAYEIERPKSIIDRIKSIFVNYEEKAIKEINVKYGYIIRTLELNITKNNVLNIADMVNDIVNKLNKVKDIDSRIIQIILDKQLLEIYQKISDSVKSAQEELRELELNSKISALEKEFSDLKRDVINTIEKLHYLNEYNEQKDTLVEKIKNIENNTKNIFDFYRLELYRVNRFILKYSIIVLKNHALKEKQKMIENIELFKKYFIENGAVFKDVQNRVLKDNEFYKCLSLGFPVVTSTLHSNPKLFKSLDKLIIHNNINPIFISFIDEAGMANVYLPFPIISVSDYVISVGDPLQIPPVVPLGNAEKEHYHEKLFINDLKHKSTEEQFEAWQNQYSPCITSVYHRSARCKTGEYNDIGQAILLNEHRRCQKPIADLFIYLADYKDIDIKTVELKEQDKERLVNFTKNENTKLIFYNIKGELGNADNTNKREVIAIYEIIKKLKYAGYSEEEIGVITPFKNQEKYIKETLHKKGLKKIQVGTVHSFQGQEFPVIIFSTVIFESSMIKKIQAFNVTPNLLNVAVSRSKHLFITVGKLDVLEKAGNTLSKFVKFYKEKQDVCIIMPEQEILSEEEAKALEIKINQFKQKAEAADYVSYREILTTDEAIIRFKEILEHKAKERIIIVTPWIYQHTLDHLKDAFEKVKQRNVDINICYGFDPKSKKDEKENENMRKAIDTLKKNGFKLVNITEKGEFGTHEKILIVDNTDIYFGSLNWLSHDYYRLLNKKTPDPLRRETVLYLQIKPESIQDIMRDMKIDKICTQIQK